MKSDIFSIDPARDRLRCTKNPEPGKSQIRDYFLNPNRFFSGVFNGDAPILVPLLILLLSIIIPIVIIQILVGYLNRFVPYLNLPGDAGMGFSLVFGLAVLWIIGILYFLIFSGEPQSPSARSRSWGTKGARIFTAMGFAIIPVIGILLVGTASLLIILPGIPIVPPPTAANEVFQHADADYQRSVSQFFASVGTGKTPDEHLAEQRMKYRQIMTESKVLAEQEATDGLKQVGSQLLQDPTLIMLGSVMQVLSVIILLWVGVLLAYGIRHALDISLSWAALLVGFLVSVHLFLTLVR